MATLSNISIRVRVLAWLPLLLIAIIVQDARAAPISITFAPRPGPSVTVPPALRCSNDPQASLPPKGPPGADLGDPTIPLAQGQVQGYRNCVDDIAIHNFLGIPYAQPPVGQLRFAKPLPLNITQQSRQSIIQAKEYGHICWQVVASNYPQEDMDEDCLTINVMAPADAHLRKQKLPVMFWHHGGGFTTGASTYHNGSRLVAESVKLGAPAIWVNFNYRINAFGFLSSTQVLEATKRGEASLNNGLYDARLALRWVRDNIAQFGGDPKRVMIFGQSAGAYAVGAQMLANGGDSEGLFSAAIMHSGSPAAGSALIPNHPRLDETFANLTAAVGCPSDAGALACLRKTNQALLGNQSAIIAQNFDDYPLLGYWPWQPVQDAEVGGYWFAAQPTTLVNQGRYAAVPLISGDCADEGTFFASQTLNNSADFDAWFRRIAVADVNPANAAHVTKLLSKLYELVPDDVTQGSPYYNAPTLVSPTGITNVSDTFYPPSTNQYKRAARMFSSWRYEAARRRFLRLFVARYTRGRGGNKHDIPVWTYRFSQLDSQIKPATGVAHGSEIVYILGNTSTIKSKGLYEPLSKEMQRAWISFANWHDPNVLGGFGSENEGPLPAPHSKPSLPNNKPCGKPPGGGKGSRPSPPNCLPSSPTFSWPRYTEAGREMIQWKGYNVTLIRDDYQEEALAYVKSDAMSAIFSS